MSFGIRVCGGTFVTQEISGARFPEVNMEQLINWNPDIIIIDNHRRDPDNFIKNIYENTDWSVINAVKNKKIYRCDLSTEDAEHALRVWDAGYENI